MASMVKDVVGAVSSLVRRATLPGSSGTRWSTRFCFVLYGWREDMVLGPAIGSA